MKSVSAFCSSRRGISLPINVVVTAIVAVMVLTLVAIFVTGGGKSLGGKYSSFAKTAVGDIHLPNVLSALSSQQQPEAPTPQLTAEECKGLPCSGCRRILGYPSGGEYSGFTLYPYWTSPNSVLVAYNEIGNACKAKSCQWEEGLHICVKSDDPLTACDIQSAGCNSPGCKGDTAARCVRYV